MFDRGINLRRRRERKGRGRRGEEEGERAEYTAERPKGKIRKGSSQPLFPEEIDDSIGREEIKGEAEDSRARKMSLDRRCGSRHLVNRIVLGTAASTAVAFDGTPSCGSTTQSCVHRIIRPLYA